MATTVTISQQMALLWPLMALEVLPPSANQNTASAFPAPPSHPSIEDPSIDPSIHPYGMPSMLEIPTQEAEGRNGGVGGKEGREKEENEEKERNGEGELKRSSFSLEMFPLCTATDFHSMRRDTAIVHQRPLSTLSRNSHLTNKIQSIDKSTTPKTKINGDSDLIRLSDVITINGDC